MKTALSIIGALGGFVTIAGVLVAAAVWFTNLRGEANSGFNALEARMGSLEIRMDNLETRMDKLETRMGNLETEIRELRALIIERLPAK